MIQERFGQNLDVPQADIRDFGSIEYKIGQSTKN